MGEQIRVPVKYYESFGTLGQDLSGMERKLEKFEIPQYLLEHLRSKNEAKFLVLGSATPDNLHNITCIDRILRPGQETHDTVFLIDPNRHTLNEHQYEKVGIDRWIKAYPKDPDNLPYPQFKFAQADMRDLPCKPQSMDVVVSDYTFNFLTTIEDIEIAFASITEALPANGILLIQVKGNDKYPYSGSPKKEGVGIPPAADVQIIKPSNTEYHLFPLQTYMDIAQRCGLELVMHDHTQQDLFGILKKASTSLNQ